MVLSTEKLWPRCAVCQMPVQKFSAQDTGYGIEMIARCHGKKQTVFVPDDIWDSFDPAGVVITEAFTDPCRDVATVTANSRSS